MGCRYTQTGLHEHPLMKLDDALKVMNDPSAKLEQRAVMQAMEHARLLREGDLTLETVPNPERALERVVELHKSGNCIWGPPQFTGGSWVIWFFKKKEG